MVEQDSGDVLPPNCRIDAACPGVEAQNIAEEEARYVEAMNTQILNNESLASRKIGLPAENVIG